MSPSYVDFVKKKHHLATKRTGGIAVEPNPPPKLLDYPIDVDVKQLLINDAVIRDNLAEAITDGEIVETMDYAAGTLELNVQDSQRTLVHGLLEQWVSASVPVVLTSMVGQRRRQVIPQEWNEIYCTLDGRDYALVQVNKNGDQFDLTFENRAIHELRRYSKPKVWFRDTYTRAQVYKSMCEEVKPYRIQFYAPELNVIQPISSTKGLPKPKEVVSKKLKGFAKGTHFSVKGKRATAQQKSHATTILHVGESLHASYTVLMSALICAIELSNLDPKGTEFGGGTGLFAFMNSTDMAKDCHAYFTNAIKQSNAIAGITADDLAWVVASGQRPGASAPFTPGEFSRWIPEGQAILDAWGTSLSGGHLSFTEYNRYAFKRGLDGKREDSWNCMVRLAKEVDWRVFSTDNILWYVSDNDLRYSIPFDTISEKTEGINTIDWEIDTGKALNSVTISADLSRWQAPPGVPIVIEDSGPANGRWLIFEVRRPLFSNVAEITCHLPAPPKPEPAPTTKRVSVKGRITAQGASGIGVNPFAQADSVRIGRTDMGVDADMAPGSKIVAPFDSQYLGVMGNWYAHGGNPGGGYYIGFRITGGKYKGMCYYLAEEINPQSFSQDQQITAGTVIAIYASSGTGIEMGLANPSNWKQTLSQAHGTYTYDGKVTPEGLQWRNILKELGVKV